LTFPLKYIKINIIRKEGCMIREAVVAGTFYDGEAQDLKKHILSLTSGKKEKVKALGIVVPHAGYVYSGRVAGEVFSSVEIPDTVIILGPNHTGLGKPISVFPEGSWQTPLGEARIDALLSAEIIKNCPFASTDIMAHAREHSIEVQLPFLQSLKKDFRFAAIVLGDYELEHLRELAGSIASAMKGKDILIIASSDLTHYEDSETAKKKDSLVLKSIEAVDPEQMAGDVQARDISMCGWMPVFTMLHACKKLGAKQGRIIKYMNSGDANGDYSEVVGYGGAVII
jgi:AmmeMemoRadiSam system protein B